MKCVLAYWNNKKPCLLFCKVECTPHQVAMRHHWWTVILKAEERGADDGDYGVFFDESDEAFANFKIDWDTVPVYQVNNELRHDEYCRGV